MEYLIKRVLKEFVESKITFKVIGTYDGILNEEISSQDLNLGREIISRRLNRINPFIGNFTDKRTGKERNVEFKIIPSKHFIKRLFRTSEPEYSVGGNHYDPKISNPDPLEGIELIYNNRDKLAEQILIGRIKDKDVVEITSADGSNYHMIVNFDENFSDSSKYTLYLVTQIKGVDFYDKKYQKKLRLYPNPRN